MFRMGLAALGGRAQAFYPEAMPAEQVDPETYANPVAARPAGSKRKCHVFAAGRQFIDSKVYPNPATMKLVDETDASEGMRNAGEIPAALCEQGVLDYGFRQSDRLIMHVS